ncbi:ThiF family adenylyltransferase [Hoeflea alexandrii]|uniref:ThiF family adenylyltransferase n=2 Tax=Hoeflea alexandrii TaxID=288436 RepID=UPI0036095F80
MKPHITLAIGGSTHADLVRHLFPGDGLEAAAILVCARSPEPRRRLLVRKAIPVPHDACTVRMIDAIVWPGTFIEDAIDMAENEGLVIVLLHSHPGGWLEFSHVDDESDARVIPGIFEAFGDFHGSAIMTPDGAIRARLYSPDMFCESVDLVTVAGDEIRYFWSDGINHGMLPERPIAFTRGMTAEFGRLSAAVIGVSGTGSIVAELLARMGVADTLLVDPDRIEWKNINRILYSTTADAECGRLKVEMLAAAIETYRRPGIARALPTKVNTREAIQAVAQCDVIFCCVDSQVGRMFADKVAAAFLIPLFDVGVVIPTVVENGRPRIVDVCGRIDYVQPGGSTLGDRQVYTPQGLYAEELRESDPDAFARQVKDGYIKGVVEEAPSVITLNMRAASTLANEFVARAYPYRLEPNHLYARTMFSLAGCDEDHTAESEFDRAENDLLGRGAAEPLLNLPVFRKMRKVA